jgi:hypothetical protein
MFPPPLLTQLTCSTSTPQSIMSHYDDLMMVLAPYLHEARYSSYGCHFTSHHLLHVVMERWDGAGLRGGAGAVGGWLQPDRSERRSWPAAVLRNWWRAPFCNDAAGAER